MPGSSTPPHEPRDLAYLWDMLMAAREITYFCRGSNLETYARNRLLQRAVERNLQILGDAAKRISNRTREASPTVPWKGIVGQRNVIVHDYAEIDPERVWRLVESEMEPLQSHLEALLSHLDPGSRNISR